MGWNEQEYSRGISKRKVKWFSEWLRMHAAACGLVGQDLRAAKGRLTFVGALLQVELFLGPLFAWSAMLHPSSFARFPLAVFLILHCIREEISRASMKVVERVPPEHADSFRMDARAGKDYVVAACRPSTSGRALVFSPPELSRGTLGLC